MKFFIIVTTLLTSALFVNAAKAQKAKFPNESNAFVIVDDSLEMSDFARLFFRSGYLFTHYDSLILLTDYKRLGRFFSVGLICNKIDSAFYVRGLSKLIDGEVGEQTQQIRYVPRFKKDFEDMYDMLNSIKPNLTIKATKL